MNVRSVKRFVVLISLLGLASFSLMAYSAGDDAEGAGAETAAGAAAESTDAAGPWFTEEQARRGAAQYRVHCASCHGAELEGFMAPSLSGGELFGNWDNAAELYGFFSVAMPPNTPGGLSDQAYTDILAHILHFNGYPAGDTELPTDPEVFAQIPIERPQ